jgi:hypothetical protein
MSVYTYRRGSIFWALVLIGVGVIFLWQNFNPSVHPWQLIAKFWPILIIFWGISKLIDYIQAQAHPETSPPPLFSGSEVVMLVLILLLGTIVTKVVLHPWQQWGWHFDDDEISSMFLNSYTYTRTFSQATSGATHLLLDNPRGDLEVRGADEPGIEGTAKESIRADDENAAKKISDSLKLDILQEAGHYVLRPGEGSAASEGGRVTVDLTLRVPIGTTCEARTHRGDIVVDGMNGDQTLDTEKGDVRATNIQGLVKIHKSGNDTQVRGIKGSVELEGRGEDVEIDDVSDTVTVHGEYSGGLQFRNVGQTLRYESQRTKMTAQKLSGRLSMEVGSLEVDGIDGPFEITTRQKDLTVNEFKHTLHITDHDGEISLATSTPPAHDIQVESKNGPVELTLPASAGFQIEATSRHGEVDCDFSGPELRVVKEGNTPSITGSYGKGGPMIRISTDYGAIRILRAGAEHSSAPAQTTWNHHTRFTVRPEKHQERRRGDARFLAFVPKGRTSREAGLGN